MAESSREQRPAGGAKLTPIACEAWKPWIFVFSMRNTPPLMNLMPILPVPMPSTERLRRFTTIPAPLMVMPSNPGARTPPNTPPQSIVTDLVMLTAPNPPGARQLMMPLATVLVRAPAKLLHGAARLHGLPSSPAPDTQVRLAV